MGESQCKACFQPEVSLKTYKLLRSRSSSTHEEDDYYEMKLEELTTIEQLSRFQDATQAVIFKGNTFKEEQGKNTQ